MPDYETSRTTFWSSARGGAGLRAAIEASAAGVSVGMVSKCLLGKAHTVMAEGGIAAALANVDDRDNWKVHFADTMRGGQYVNNWRMAELHAQEAPGAGPRTRGLGRGVRPHQRWPDSAAKFRRPQISAPRARRRSDRLGNDPHLAGSRDSSGIDVHMEVCVLALLKDGMRVCGAFGYDRERGRFRVFRAKAIILATGGIGKAYKITSNSWDCTGDGHALAYHAGAELIDME